MINCVIAEHVLTTTQLPPPSTTMPARRQGCALAAHLLHHNEHHSAETTAEHFIGAVLDDDTGAALEYQHLIKSEKYRSIWVHSFANELGDCSRAYATYLAQTHVSSSRNFKSRHTSAPPTVASAATFAYKRKRSIALDYRSAVISSIFPETRAPPPRTFSPPNSSSTPPSAHRAPCSSALTWPTSTLTL